MNSTTLREIALLVVAAVTAGVANAQQAYSLEPRSSPLYLAAEGDTPSAPSTAEEERDNTESFTKPQRRIDQRLQYKHVSQGNEEYTWTTRLERSFELGYGWKLATRFDLPVTMSDKSSSDNPNNDYQAGLGDVLTQFAIVKTMNDRWTWAAGSQFIFPTATEDGLGKGKYIAVPSAGFRYALPEISKGSYVAPLFRYGFDYAGDGDRSHYSVLEIGPELKIALPDNWYVSFYPSTDIRYNFDGGDWFVPIDVQVGRKLSDRIVISVEASYGLVTDYDLYDFKTEFRIGFFF